MRLSVKIRGYRGWNSLAAARRSRDVDMLRMEHGGEVANVAEQAGRIDGAYGLCVGQVGGGADRVYAGE
jgi:hypothetical protein